MGTSPSVVATEAVSGAALEGAEIVCLGLTGGQLILLGGAVLLGGFVVYKLIKMFRDKN